MKILKCDNCGQTRDRVMFVIGASREPDWCMHEGTGRVSCPNCYPLEAERARLAIEKHTGIKDVRHV
jgi:hypothetical protein